MKKIRILIPALLALALLFLCACAGAEGSRAINYDSLTLYKGAVVSSDYYTEAITLTVREGDSDLSGTVWSSSNESIATVDQEGHVAPQKCGIATITGTLEGKSYTCKIDIREIRQYTYWVYTGRSSANYWMWDYGIDLSVGQTAKYRLEEWCYNSKGKVSEKIDVTSRYPLTAEAPDYISVTPGKVTALKPGSSQETNTSRLLYYFPDPLGTLNQRIVINVFTDTVESCAGLVRIDYAEDELCCYLVCNDHTGYFPLDDSMFITAPDFYMTRCKPEEFEWRSSNPEVLKFTGSVKGSRPDKIYCSAGFDLLKKGTVKVSVWYNGTKLAESDKITVTRPRKSEPEGTKATIGDLKYTLSGSTAVVTGPKDKNARKLTIPATVSKSGKTYKVTEIKAGAFKGMKKLTNVTIGKNVTKIGKSAFEKCAKLKKITIKNAKMKKAGFGSGSFKGIYAKAAFKVPKSALKNYKTWITGTGKAPKTVKVTK